ncbi:hypothetical protein VZC37_24185 [Gordonia sp. LSe1-13]|uniref:PH domain-containing protein n=1 Tax=Gordonia sesuvii TaxID=3116777 RepID=A0ABU7MK06_9ACTN|nr:hypothetical protein [Gordonia sp. LSe1-13]
MHEILRTTRLPDGGTRTHAIADREIVTRMARAEYLGMRAIWLVLAPACVVSPIVWNIADMVFGDADTGRGAMVTLALSPVVGAASFVMLLAILLITTGPRQAHRKIPAGTPLYADVGPQWIGFGHGEVYEAVAVGQIDRVRHIGSVLVISGGATTLTIPDEMVPPRAHADLVERYRRGHRNNRAPRVGPVVPAGPPPPPHIAVGIDGVIRASAIAGPDLSDRLARAARRSPGAYLTLATAPLPMIGVTLHARETGGVTWETMAIGGYMTVMIVGIVGYFMFFGIRRHYRREVRPGSPISAEYGADRIVLRLGDRVDALSTAGILHVKHAGSAYVLTCTEPVGGFVIPDELVPPQAAGRLRRRGRRRSGGSPD